MISDEIGNERHTGQPHKYIGVIGIANVEKFYYLDVDLWHGGEKDKYALHEKFIGNFSFEIFGYCKFIKFI